MAITLQEAMGRIATVQLALVANGYDAGTYGPCGDGVDGRWGPSTRAAWSNFLMAAGMSMATPEALVQLGVTTVTLDGLNEAVDTWNQFRNNMIASGAAPGTAEYEETANAALMTATGISEATCPGAAVLAEVPPEGTVGPETAMVPAPQAVEKGFPWWILGIVALAVVGGGVAVWWFSKERMGRRVRRSSKAATVSGWGRSPEITDEELGGGYEGYGQLGSGQEEDDDEEGT